MAAKKSSDVSVEHAGDPSPGSALGDGGVSVQQYFTEQDQVVGSRRNPKRAAVADESDLISAVDACKLINGVAGYLMFDPSAIYRDAGKSAPSVHETSPGSLKFSRRECDQFAKEWVSRKQERSRLKAEEAAAAKEMAEFYADTSQNPGVGVQTFATSPDYAS